MSDIDTAVVDSLKVLDLKWPIREADMVARLAAKPGRSGRRRHPAGSRLLRGYVNKRRPLNRGLAHQIPRAQ